MASPGGRQVTRREHLSITASPVPLAGLGWLKSPTAMPYAAVAGAVLGSWLLVGVPLALALALAAACAWRPSPLLAFAVFAAFAGFFGTRALDGLADPPQGRVGGWVTLLDDPRPLGTNGIRVTVRHAGARVEARAYGAVAARLDDALAGERVRVSGTARPATSDWPRWRPVAATRTVDGQLRRGFVTYVGGGLGAVPHQAKLLDEFLPEEELLPLAQAIARVFARLGEKKNRARARIKFLVAQLGLDEFKRLVLEERAKLADDPRWRAHLAAAATYGAQPLQPAAALTGLPSQSPPDQ